MEPAAQLSAPSLSAPGVLAVDGGVVAAARLRPGLWGNRFVSRSSRTRREQEVIEFGTPLRLNW